MTQIYEHYLWLRYISVTNGDFQDSCPKNVFHAAREVSSAASGNFRASIFSMTAMYQIYSYAGLIIVPESLKHWD